MEIKILSKEKGCLELEVKGADETILYPVVTQLLSDSNVEEARYFIGQIATEAPTLYIRTKDGKPQTALKKALKHLSSEFENAKKVFDKATK